jgi:hypothetical protein
MTFFSFSFCARHATIALLLAGTSTSAGAEWQLDADAGAVYDSNVNRAYERADVRADTALMLNAAAGSYQALGGADGLTLSAGARSELYGRFHGLNVLGVAGTAAYRHKFGLGYAAPWILLSATAAHDDYRGNIRDSDRVTLLAELGQRFTADFDAAFGAAYQRRYAQNNIPVVPGISGEVFDLRGLDAHVRAGYAISDRLQLGAELAVRRGDVVASTRPDAQIFLVSSAIAADPTFGPDFVAYRLRGTTDTASINASWALDERSSFNLAYADERTAAAGGIVYRSRSANAVFVWRY